MWDSPHYRALKDRVHAGQLATFRRRVTGSNGLTLLNEQLAGDRLFRKDPELAYAHAWALTFYLSEQQPRRYSQYLKLVSRRDPFLKYGAEDRLADFFSVFDKNLPLLEARIQRFVATLPN